MSTFKIAIVSDLHCCHSKTSGADRSRLLSDMMRIPAKQHPVESLLELIDQQHIQSDVLVCPGDITNRVDKQGLVTGFNYLQEIQNALNAKQLFCTPGNHDVDSRDIYKLSDSSEILKCLHKRYPFENDELKQSFWSENFCLYENELIELLLFNSTFNHTNEEKALKAIIPELTLSKIQAKIEQKKDSSKIKVFVCHHHPYPFSNVDSVKYKDGDFLENGDKLLNILRNNGYYLVIHGHKHIPRYLFHDGVHLFAAGSFSSLENIAEGNTSNSFHIIELHTSNSILKAQIKTWYFTSAKGWSISRDPDEIFPSLTGFGSEKNTNEIALSIHNYFETESKDRVKFEEIVNIIPDILYLSPDQQICLEKMLENSYGLKILNSLGTSPNEILKQLI